MVSVNEYEVMNVKEATAKYGNDSVQEAGRRYGTA